VAPRKYKADLAWEHFERAPDEPCSTSAVAAYGTRSPHLFSYGLELRTLMKQAWDAIYAWEEPYILSGAQLARWAPPSAVFTFLTLQNIRKRYPPPFSWFERATLARADGWFYCGHSIHRAQHDKAGYAERPSQLGPLGVDIDLFRPDSALRRRVRESLGWSDDGPPVIGFVGRFVPEKGLHVLMRALESVSEPWRVLFLGGGSMEPELRRWASAGRADRVRIATVRHAEVPDYLRAVDLLCAPSETTPRWAEQFGRMLVEAFACAIPVIGSDSGEIPHVVGDAGLIAKERDAAAWTRAISELLGDAKRRAELGQRGLARAHAEYAWPVVARAYLDFFEELGARRP
jgi:glycosyltransferase involved in cell wall biosynthesis